MTSSHDFSIIGASGVVVKKYPAKPDENPSKSVTQRAASFIMVVSCRKMKEG
jgi:hypothetical protein